MYYRVILYSGIADAIEIVPVIEGKKAHNLLLDQGNYDSRRWYSRRTGGFATIECVFFFIHLSKTSITERA